MDKFNKKLSLFLIVISIVLIGLVIFYPKINYTFGATIITTGTTSTIGEFRTNVNTSLINLNNALGGSGSFTTSTLAGLTDTTWILNSANGLLTISTSTSPSTITFTASTSPQFTSLSVNTSSSVGTVISGVWNGTAIGDAYISSATNWNTAYTDRLKWDGGATGLVAATGRTSLGLTDTATLASSTWAKVANNLSDLSSTSTARTNLGLGTLSTGTFSTSTGNLIVASSTNGYIAFPVGTNGKVLTASSTSQNGVSWETPVSGASGFESQARIYLTNNQTVTTGVTTSTRFDTISFDPLGEFSTTTTKTLFTANATGTYIFDMTLRATNPGDTNEVSVISYKNGSPYGSYAVRAGGAGAVSSGYSDLIKLNKNDTLECQVYMVCTTSCVIEGGSGTTFFTVSRVY